MWEFAKNYKYKVEVSTDNTTWTMASDKTASTNAAQTQTDSFSVAGGSELWLTGCSDLNSGSSVTGAGKMTGACFEQADFVSGDKHKARFVQAAASGATEHLQNLV